MSWNDDPNDPQCPAEPEPRGTWLDVRVRAADNWNDLPSLSYTAVQNHVPLVSIQGQYIEVQVVFHGRIDCDETFHGPVLCNLTVSAGPDCNSNGIADACDILRGTSQDCDANGVPDECDPDRDGDQIPDACDICPDDPLNNTDDGDGIPPDQDNCPCSSNPGQEDCDGDGVGEQCDPIPRSLLDFDRDCDVDQSDFAHMEECRCDEGPAVTGDCQNAYVSGDLWYGYAVITEHDLALFERCASGPGMVVAIGCGDCNGDGIHDARQHFVPNYPGDPSQSPDGDADYDGIFVRGNPICTGVPATDCDDNCPCMANADQLDSDGDGVGDECDPTPYPPPPPSPPPPFVITAWRSARIHGTASRRSIGLDPNAEMESATIEPRQGDTQIIEADLSEPAYPASFIDLVVVTGADSSRVYPASITFRNNATTVVVTFVDDPELTEDLMLDQMCYTIDLSMAIINADWTRMIQGDAVCAIRMLAADVDADAVVAQADATAIAVQYGQTVTNQTCRYDLNLDAVIDTADSDLAVSLIGNSVTCGGGMMMMGMGQSVMLGNVEGTAGRPDLLTLLREQAAAPPTPTANVSAALVVHGTGENTVTLPAAGGSLTDLAETVKDRTISVDVVVTSDAPIWGFEGQLAADVAGVITINAADWTDRDNVLMSNGQPSATLASYYDLSVMDWLWIRTDADGQVIDSGTDVDSLLEPDPPTVVALVSSLADLSGPIATPAGEISGLDAGGWFVTTATIGGATRELLAAGQTTLATLSLTITGAPGAYHVTLVNGSFAGEAMQTAPMSPGPSLEVIVQGQ